MASASDLLLTITLTALCPPALSFSVLTCTYRGVLEFRRLPGRGEAVTQH